MNLIFCSSVGREFVAQMQLGLQVSNVRPPILPHLFVQLDGGKFVDANHHPLAPLFPTHKMIHQIFRHLLQAVVTGN
jgi:hypothetical protein